MNAAKYPPTPWKLEKYGRGVMIVAPGYRVVADLNAREASHLRDIPATAQLFLTSLRLLSGCEEALELLRSYGLQDHQVACNLEAAIAEAGGAT